jgi:hypothetical protein
MTMMDYYLYEIFPKGDVSFDSFMNVFKKSKNFKYICF